MNKSAETRSRNKELRRQREEERKRIDGIIRETCLCILKDPSVKPTDKLRAVEILAQRL